MLERASSLLDLHGAVKERAVKEKEQMDVDQEGGEDANANANPLASHKSLEELLVRGMYDRLRDAQQVVR